MISTRKQRAEHPLAGQNTQQVGLLFLKRDKGERGGHKKSKLV